MENINLLPKKYHSSGPLLKITRTLKMVNFIGTVTFFLTVFIFVFLIVLNQNQINSLQTNQEQLKSSIKSLSQVETQYVLMKNRAESISKIFEEDLTSGYLDAFKKLFASSRGVVIDKVDISSTKTSYDLTVANYSDLVLFLDSLTDLNLYKKATLESFVFDPDSGYYLTLNVN